MAQNNKIRRTLKLFFGMTDPAVVDALTPFGFGPHVLEDGFERLVRANILRGDGKAVVDPKRQLVVGLEQFDATWFPITRAVLEAGFPVVAEKLFVNLNREQGLGVTLTVAGLLARVAELEDPNGRFGADGPAARALLATRGLTVEVAAEAQGLLRALTDIDEPAAPDTEAEQQAMKNVWRWYREWGTIARVAVKQRALLRKLGFLERRRANDGGVEGGVDANGALLVAPVTVTTPPAVTPPAVTPPATLPALTAPVAIGGLATLIEPTPIAAE